MTAELVCRQLTIADLPALEEIVRGRERFLGAIPNDVERNLARLKAGLEGRPINIAVFRDGILDCFMFWRYIPDMPRADDPYLTEMGSITWAAWSRKRPDREKLETGHDVAMPMLSRGLLEIHEQHRVYTAWSTMNPVTWRTYTAAPSLADVMQRWVRLDMATYEPGEGPQGVAADYCRDHVAATNPYPVAVVCRAVTLKEEHRNAGQGS